MKIKLIRSHEGTDYYEFYCLGCKEMHVISSQWDFNGDLGNPSFSPSYLVYGIQNENFFSPRCHSFIKGGKIQYLIDCEHDLRGQTIDMIDESEWESRYSG